MIRIHETDKLIRATIASASRASCDVVSWTEMKNIYFWLLIDNERTNSRKDVNNILMTHRDSVNIN